MMDDLISRQAAITAIQKAYADTEGGTDKCAVWKNVGLTNALHIMQDLPSAQPILYGYNIEHLELIARVLQKEDLPPERIVEALTDIGRIVEIVKDEYEEALRKAVEQCTI